MNSRPFVGLSLFLLMLGSVTKPTIAQDQPKQTVHRIQAGKPNKEGRYEAKSTDGKYSVSFPLPFNETTTRAKTRNGGDLTVCVLGTRSASGVKFSAAETLAVPAPEPPIDLESIAENFKKDGRSKVSRERSFEYQGYPAHEFLVEGSSTSASIRNIRAQGRLYQLIVEFPDAERTAANALIKPFFESLKIEADPNARR